MASAACTRTFSAPTAVGNRHCHRRPLRILAAAAIGAASLLQQAFLVPGAAPRAAGAAPRPLRAAGGSRLWCQASSPDLEVDGTVEPLGSYVLVKVKEAQEFSPGGILLPTKGEQPRGGEVAAVGPGEPDARSGVLRPVELQPGRKVVYSKYGGTTTVKCSGVDHTLVRQDEILYSYEGEEATLDNLKMPRGMLLVQLEEAEQETKGGLLLSRDATKPSTTVGKVMAVGAGEWLANDETMDPPVEVGDTVRFRYGDEVELDIGDERYSAVKMSNLIAKWKVA